MSLMSLSLITPVHKFQFGYAIKMILAHAAVTLTITFALYARIFVEAWRLLQLDAGLHHHGHYVR